MPLTKISAKLIKLTGLETNRLITFNSNLSKMVLIGDGGSTKADWRLVASNKIIESFSTEGFNPFLNTAETIQNILQTVKWSKGIKTIHYYGTGCSEIAKIEKLKSIFQTIIQAESIHIHHDLLGAARALCLRKQGVACILGTGSNSCLYDGNGIIDNVTNLGYIAGDEGSANDLGKRLIQAYFYRELPKELEQAFEQEFPGGRQIILKNLYEQEKPNAFLGEFAPFYTKYPAPLLKSIAKAAFDNFVKRHLLKYSNIQSMPIHFTGSIAYYFKDWIQEVLIENGLKIGNFVQKPIDRLVAFHSS